MVKTMAFLQLPQLSQLLQIFGLNLGLIALLAIFPPISPEHFFRMILQLFDKDHPPEPPEAAKNLK
jgi:hypothetical protein